MLNREELRNYIVSNEGLRQRAYNDSLGIPTIGVGFNLNRHDANWRLSELGLNYEHVYYGRQELTIDQINHLLDSDLDNSISSVQKLFPNFNQFSSKRQIVLVDLVFNLGINRLSTFVKMIAAINEGNWQTAAKELENSNYYTQVGRRGIRNSLLLVQDDLTNAPESQPQKKRHWLWRLFFN
ncbi:glycoside hydrolase family protein [Arcticibacterium luteifluviistationis]|uniref:Lysozyme n=1 Tax=Arcticibacterium luteifluviistationis TaxID=1784714 RepID=A0A2Z4G8T1_9BACT|nr:glycoside hydrolase family protein [Arcticibacterium luteifluviistationis]AWV97515.1 hypothetical protein DJ013_04770 [Arcticibacterium luteifluviistationis]